MASIIRQAFNESTEYPTALLWNLIRAGNFVALAELDKEVIGVLVGHIGLGDDLFLYSGPLAVRKDHRQLGVATSLKRYQREWAIKRGITRIMWPFHPLNISSAYVSLSLPGVRCLRFEPDYYGPRPNGSRLVAYWDLVSVDEERGSVMKWLKLDGQSESELMANFLSLYSEGYSVVTFSRGNYGLALSKDE